MRGRVLPEKSSFQLYFPAPLLGVSSYYRESGAHLSRQSAREESRVPSLLDRHFKCETRSEKTYPFDSNDELFEIADKAIGNESDKEAEATEEEEVNACRKATKCNNLNHLK